MDIDFPQNLQRHYHTDEHDQSVLIDYSKAKRNEVFRKQCGGEVLQS